MESIAEAFFCKGEVLFTGYYPAVINHYKETKIVEELAVRLFGLANVSDEDLPLYASEDFSFFL